MLELKRVRDELARIDAHAAEIERRYLGTKKELQHRRAELIRLIEIYERQTSVVESLEQKRVQP